MLYGVRVVCHRFRYAFDAARWSFSPRFHKKAVPAWLLFQGPPMLTGRLEFSSDFTEMV